MRSCRCLFLVGLATCVEVALAATPSLDIPGIDIGSYSFDVAGVDSQGRTTYVIQEPSGAVSDGDDYGALTVVADENNVSLTYVNEAYSLTLGAQCAYSSGLAVCEEVVNGFSTTMTTSIPTTATSPSITSDSATPTTPRTTLVVTPSSARSSASSEHSSSSSSSGSASATATSPANKSNAAWRSTASGAAIFGVGVITLASLTLALL